MNVAIILASGMGSRMGAGKPKQFLSFKGQTIIEHSIQAFNSHAEINKIIVVMHPDFMDEFRALLAARPFKKIHTVINGGAMRSDSAYNGLLACPKGTKNVLIHDAARPFVSERIITNCCAALKIHKAICVAVQATDTIAMVNEKNEIVDLPKRSSVYHNQTPQAFSFDLILKGHKKAKEEGIKVTDDVSIIHYFGLDKVHIVKGDEANIKITYPSDLES
jgi:2-C-methyl-D-erythritol 4-phosphate cytidylyltransferase